MLTKKRISDIVKAGIQDMLPNAPVSRIDVQDELDSLGEPSLAILVVFSKRPPFKGEDFFSLREAIQKRLQMSGKTATRSCAISMKRNCAARFHSRWTPPISFVTPIT